MKEETIPEIFARWEKEDAPWFHDNLCKDIIGKNQFLLRCKTSWLALLEKLDPHQYYTLRHDGKFGISENAVNQLMHLAYQKGLQHSNPQDYEKGYQAAMKEVAKKLELNYD